MALLSVVTVGGTGLLLATFTGPTVGLVGSGGDTDLDWATKFAVVYDLAASELVLFVGLSRSL